MVILSDMSIADAGELLPEEVASLIITRLLQAAEDPSQITKAVISVSLAPMLKHHLLLQVQQFKV